jgi:hypothetical protein
MSAALLDFVEIIERAGGVYVDNSGIWHPIGDPIWTDLGDTYRLACQELGREPKIVDEDDA